MTNVEEYFQYKHREKWTLIDIEARKGFMNCTESKIKFAASVDICRERI